MLYIRKSYYKLKSGDSICFKIMKEYNSIQLEDREAQVLMDISKSSNNPIKPIPLEKDIDPETMYIPDEDSFFFEENHVIGLTFVCSELKNLPRSIGNFKFLRFLIIRDSLVQSIPSSIRNLQSLELLTITYDSEIDPEINLELPDVFQDLISLKTFQVEGLFTIYIPPSFIKLRNLEKLKISQSLFFTNYKNYEDYLRNNSNFVGMNELPIDFDELISLKHLSLNLLLKIKFPNSITNLKSLIELDLTDSIDFINFDVIFEIKSLIKLHLRRCRLKFNGM